MNRFYLLIPAVLLFGSCQKEPTQPQPAVQVSETRLFRYGGVLDEANSYYWLDVAPTGLQATVVLENQPHQLAAAQTIVPGKDIPELRLTDGSVTLSYAYNYIGDQPTVRISTPVRTLTSTFGTIYNYRLLETDKQAEPIALYTGFQVLSNCPAAGTYIYNMALDFTHRKYTVLHKKKDLPTAEAVLGEGYFWETKTAIELGSYSLYTPRTLEDDSTLDFQKAGTNLVCDLSATRASDRGLCQTRIDLEKH